MKKALILVIVASILAVLGQALFKLATKSFPLFSQPITEIVLSLITNWALIIGLILYVSSAISLVLAMRHGELSSIYPIYSLTFVWVALASVVFLKEPFTWSLAIGILAIVAGIICISKKEATHA